MWYFKVQRDINSVISPEEFRHLALLQETWEEEQNYYDFDSVEEKLFYTTRRASLFCFMKNMITKNWAVFLLLLSWPTVCTTGRSVRVYPSLASVSSPPPPTLPVLWSQPRTSALTRPVIRVISSVVTHVVHSFPYKLKKTTVHRMNNSHLHVLPHFNLIKKHSEQSCLFPYFIFLYLLSTQHVFKNFCPCRVAISYVVIENRIIKEIQLNLVTVFRNKSKETRFHLFIIIHRRECEKKLPQ
jgi:hypothetical protein